MRISNRHRQRCGDRARALGLAPALAFDGTHVAAPSAGAADVRRSRRSAPAPQALKAGENDKALTSLQYAAEQGHALRAVEARPHVCRGRRRAARRPARLRVFPAGSPTPMPTTIRRSPQARFVANAFVALGHYYLEGIPNTRGARRARAARAHVRLCGVLFRRSGCAVSARPRSISTATASTRDPEAGGAAGWCSPPTRGSTRRRRCSAASCSTASMASRQRARGLMWLTLACDGPGAKEPWIAEAARDAGAAGDRRRARARADPARALGRRPARVGALGRAGAQAASISRSINTGTWSDGFSQERTCLSMPAAREPVGGLRRQQQVVDADAPVLLPGAGLIIPEGVEPGARRWRRGSRRSGRDWSSARNFSRVCGRNSASFDPGGRIVDVGGGRDDVVVAGQDQRLFQFKPLTRVVMKPVHPFEFVGIFFACPAGCRWAGRSTRRAARRSRSRPPPR